MQREREGTLMGTGEHRFRSAAFGFNRQDVVNYIESVHKDYAAKLRELEERLNKERQERSAVEEKQSLAGQEAAAAGEDAQRAKEDMARAVEELGTARREREELRLRLQTLEKEYADLQEAADRMAPAARAYEALKDKAASIELEAHSRAETIVQEGERQAERTRREVAAWMRKVESSYTRLKSDVAATLSHAVGELDRTGRSLDEVAVEMEHHGARLHAMTQDKESGASKTLHMGPIV